MKLFASHHSLSSVSKYASFISSTEASSSDPGVSFCRNSSVAADAGARALRDAQTLDWFFQNSDHVLSRAPASSAAATLPASSAATTLPASPAAATLPAATTLAVVEAAVRYVCDNFECAGH